MDKLTLAQLTSLYNDVVRWHKNGKPVQKFADKKVALRRLREALATTEEDVIILLEPETMKRGKALTKFQQYRCVQITSDLLQRFEKVGFDRTAMLRDIRHNRVHGIVKVI